MPAVALQTTQVTARASLVIEDGGSGVEENNSNQGPSVSSDTREQAHGALWYSLRFEYKIHEAAYNL